MIDQSLAAQTLSAAMRSGADFAELYFEDGLSNTLSMVAGAMENAISSRSVGAGIRVIKGLNYVYVYTNDITSQGLLTAAQQAAAAIGPAQKQGVDLVLNAQRAPQNNPITRPSAGVALSRKAEVVKQAYAAGKEYHQQIVQVRSNYIDWSKDVLVANTEGLYKQDSRSYSRLAVMAVASDGTDTQTGYEGPGAHQGFEFFENLDVAAYGREAARAAMTLLKAELCPSGRMPVIIGNGFGGVIFHEACGHPLEAAFVSKNESVFAGKLGLRIAAPCVSATDDGTIPNAWGSTNMDDEGTPTQNNLLIENGILKSYLVDKLSALRMGGASNGAGRRQNYRFAPTSRMSNTFIMAGNDSLDDMISTMGDGIYCKKMSGGSVNPITSEFNFAVSEAYLVKDGKIAHPLRGATLIGKGSEILEKIDRVSSDLEYSQGMCGADSGSIPASLGQPSIRVSEITVGGQKGE